MAVGSKGRVPEASRQVGDAFVTNRLSADSDPGSHLNGCLGREVVAVSGWGAAPAPG